MSIVESHDGHRFAVGRTVRLTGLTSGRNAALGTYEIMAQLPERDGELQYRVKSASEPYQRIVKQDDIVPA